jgi:mRNA-degrading endonuclease RelE of RelBE toxin-antitoxin system
MSFNIEVTNKFKRRLKLLLRKFPSLKQELSALINSLEENPMQGTPMGHNCYKIRLAIKSKGKGKSGGARIITHVYVTKTIVYLLTIYDKSEQENISDNELKELLTNL